jgi:hypothetical protein
MSSFNDSENTTEMLTNEDPVVTKRTDITLIRDCCVWNNKENKFDMKKELKFISANQTNIDNISLVYKIFNLLLSYYITNFNYVCFFRTRILYS